MLRHAFEALGCVRVEFKADAENVPSRRALERLGATYEGGLRHYTFGTTHDVRAAGWAAGRGA